MKRNQLGKMFVSAAASIAIALSTAAQLCITPVSASNTDTGSTVVQIGNYIQNGSFEAPNIEQTITNNSYTSGADTGDGISYNNGWMVTSKTTYDKLANNEFYWNTTASNQRIEFVDAKETTGNFFGTETEKSAAHGDQFAELVAEEESSLYQNITTDSGSTLTWSISHRARVNTTDNNRNSMAVFIGPQQTGLKKQSRESNDIFKQMAMLLYTDFSTLNVGMSSKAITLYSVPVTDGMEVTEESVSKYYLSNKYTQEWRCWIITSDAQKWYEYSDTYKVPKGQTATTLAFAALNGGKDSNVYLNAGNLIDDVRFGVMYPLNVSTTPGGTGYVEYYNDDRLSDDVVTLDNSPYIKNFEKDTEVTIKAVPDKSETDKTYKFIGAMIDGEIVNVNDERFTPVEGSSGAYSFNLTMDQARHAVLFFALTGKVTYAPNGGTFENAASGFDNGEFGVQKVYTSVDGWSLIQSAGPNNNGKTFAGWRIYTDGDINFANENDNSTSKYNGEFIPSNHTVECVQLDDDKFKYIITYNDVNGEAKRIVALSSDRTLLFVAEYYNTLTVKSCYVGVGDVTEHGNSAGGTAKIVNESNPGATSIQLYSGQEFTLTAVPKIGYEFSGWYLQTGETGDDVSPIASMDETYTAKFYFNTDVTIHARFVETAVNPKVAVIAQDPEAKNTLTDKGITNTITDFTDGYGGDVYGNTISTCFDIKRDFGEMSGDIGGVWTIYIPTNGTFMKVTKDGTGVNYKYLDMSDNGIIVSDTENVENNNGTIYATKLSDEHGETEKFEFYVHSNTTVTGGTAVFGIVIDNVYAPNATAGFMVTDDRPNAVKELDDEHSIYTNYNDAGKYEHDEGKLSADPSDAGE